ncbi:hypothetical protein JKP88DRAFT_242698 [Tribonema minus]|uniref:RanBP2-type domain-containing protein n=1 Tax=Tribonema minus TaxID=303371 RepID=A0A836CNE2_9STRA|nr:hypothetical protein JKP88DRAFT_242698 [Tribonema minus]
MASGALHRGARGARDMPQRGASGTRPARMEHGIAAGEQRQRRAAVGEGDGIVRYDQVGAELVLAAPERLRHRRRSIVQLPPLGLFHQARLRVVSAPIGVNHSPHCPVCVCAWIRKEDAREDEAAANLRRRQEKRARKILGTLSNRHVDEDTKDELYQELLYGGQESILEMRAQDLKRAINWYICQRRVNDTFKVSGTTVSHLRLKLARLLLIDYLDSNFNSNLNSNGGGAAQRPQARSSAQAEPPASRGQACVHRSGYRDSNKLHTWNCTGKRLIRMHMTAAAAPATAAVARIREGRFKERGGRGDVLDSGVATPAALAAAAAAELHIDIAKEHTEGSTDGCFATAPAAAAPTAAAAAALNSGAREKGALDPNAQDIAAAAAATILAAARIEGNNRGGTEGRGGALDGSSIAAVAAAAAAAAQAELRRETLMDDTEGSTDGCFATAPAAAAPAAATVAAPNSGAREEAALKPNAKDIAAAAATTMAAAARSEGGAKEGRGGRGDALHGGMAAAAAAATAAQENAEGSTEDGFLAIAAAVETAAASTAAARNGGAREEGTAAPTAQDKGEGEGEEERGEARLPHGYECDVFIAALNARAQGRDAIAAAPFAGAEAEKLAAAANGYWECVNTADVPKPGDVPVTASAATNPQCLSNFRTHLERHAPTRTPLYTYILCHRSHRAVLLLLLQATVTAAAAAAQESDVDVVSSNAARAVEADIIFRQRNNVSSMFGAVAGTAAAAHAFDGGDSEGVPQQAWRNEAHAQYWRQQMERMERHQLGMQENLQQRRQQDLQRRHWRRQQQVPRQHLSQATSEVVQAAAEAATAPAAAAAVQPRKRRHTKRSSMERGHPPLLLPLHGGRRRRADSFDEDALMKDLYRQVAAHYMVGPEAGQADGALAQEHGEMDAQQHEAPPAATAAAPAYGATSEHGSSDSSAQQAGDAADAAQEAAPSCADSVPPATAAPALEEEPAVSAHHASGDYSINGMDIGGAQHSGSSSSMDNSSAQYGGARSCNAEDVSDAASECAIYSASDNDAAGDRDDMDAASCGQCTVYGNSGAGDADMDTASVSATSSADADGSAAPAAAAVSDAPDISSGGRRRRTRSYSDEDALMEGLARQVAAQYMVGPEAGQPEGALAQEHGEMDAQQHEAPPAAADADPAYGVAFEHGNSDSSAQQAGDANHDAQQAAASCVDSVPPAAAAPVLEGEPGVAAHHASGDYIISGSAADCSDSGLSQQTSNCASARADGDGSTPGNSDASHAGGEQESAASAALRSRKRKRAAADDTPPRKRPAAGPASAAVAAAAAEEPAFDAAAAAAAAAAAVRARLRNHRAALAAAARAAAPHAASRRRAAAHPKRGSWRCKACTALNHAESRTCHMCNAAAHDTAQRAAAAAGTPAEQSATAAHATAHAAEQSSIISSAVAAAMAATAARLATPRLSPQPFVFSSDHEDGGSAAGVWPDYGGSTGLASGARIHPPGYYAQPAQQPPAAPADMGASAAAGLAASTHAHGAAGREAGGTDNSCGGSGSGSGSDSGSADDESISAASSPLPGRKRKCAPASEDAPPRKRAFTISAAAAAAAGRRSSDSSAAGGSDHSSDALRASNGAAVESDGCLSDCASEGGARATEEEEDAECSFGAEGQGNRLAATAAVSAAGGSARPAGSAPLTAAARAAAIGEMGEPVRPSQRPRVSWQDPRPLVAAPAAVPRVVDMLPAAVAASAPAGVRGQDNPFVVARPPWMTSLP